MVPQASLEIITMLICISIVHSRIFTLYSISVRLGLVFLDQTQTSMLMLYNNILTA